MSHADQWAALCRETDKLARLDDPRVVVTRTPDCVRVAIDLEGDGLAVARVEQRTRRFNRLVAEMPA
jgi:hypothetical protein